MKINSLEDFLDLELACPCGGETKALLKAMTIEGGKAETVLAVSYYLQDANTEPDAHRPGCSFLASTDGRE